MHFFLLQNAFLLTAECISPYCIRSLKDPAHHIPNQTEIATEEFCPKSLLRKQNEIDFIESHIQNHSFTTLRRTSQRETKFSLGLLWFKTITVYFIDFPVLESKFATIKDYRLLLWISQATEKIFSCKFRVFAFKILKC